MEFPLILKEGKITYMYWAFATVMFCVSVTDRGRLAADVLEVARPTQKKKKTNALRVHIALSSRTLMESAKASRQRSLLYVTNPEIPDVHAGGRYEMRQARAPRWRKKRRKNSSA